MGEYDTEPGQQTMAKIAGEVSFTMDIRSESNEVLLETDATLRQVAGRIGEEEFLERSGWYTPWGFAWGFYRDPFALFREHRLAVHGINVTREQRSSAAKGELAPELLEEVGGLDLEVEPHRRYLSDALTDNGHGDGLTVESPQFLRLLRVQVLWDHVMGNRAAKPARARGPDSARLVLIGSAHRAFKLGANLRAARARPDLPQITLLDRYTHRQNLDADGRFPIPVGLADVVRVDLLRKDATKPPTLRGLKLAAAEAGIRVEGLGRGLPSRDSILAVPTQRLDAAFERLRGAARSLITERLHRTTTLAARLKHPRELLSDLAGKVSTAGRVMRAAWNSLLGRALDRGSTLGKRLSLRAAERARTEGARQLGDYAPRLARAAGRLADAEAKRLTQAGSLLESYSFRRVLDRGYAVVRDSNGRPVTRAAATAG